MHGRIVLKWNYKQIVKMSVGLRKNSKIEMAKETQKGM
jgi:hypothetical protein